MIEEGLLLPAVAYAEARRHQAVFKREMRAAFKDVDILLTPATPAPAPAGLASTGDPAFNAPWSYAGLPAVDLPVGLSPEGLPTAVQLVARPFAEVDLLTVARWCEARIGFQAQPPL
jgi:Asp-tRNA(Asn)/Glu-tRNA(Gln) amidotransferase A subunit family amidase